MEFEPPPPPDSSVELLPGSADSFGESLWSVVIEGANYLAPSLSEAAGCCLRVFAVVLLTAMAAQFLSGISAGALELGSTVAVAALLLEPSSSLLELGMQTVRELQEYGNLLVGVLASALAARGGVTVSAALYAGTAVFHGVLGAAVSSVFMPMLWMFLALAVADGALGDKLLSRLKALLKWMMEWSLKLTLYLFTGYMTITGVISGTADAAAAKAARIAISGAVPVVGGILADAADAVLLSASALGSGAGVWGILTVIACFCVPALRLGCQYLLLKITAAAGGALGGLRCVSLAEDFAGALGLQLALVSTQTVLLLISTVCFLRGMAP